MGVRFDAALRLDNVGDHRGKARPDRRSDESNRDEDGADNQSRGPDVNHVRHQREDQNPRHHSTDEQRPTSDAISDLPADDPPAGRDERGDEHDRADVGHRDTEDVVQEDADKRHRRAEADGDDQLHDEQRPESPVVLRQRTEQPSTDVHRVCLILPEDAL